MQRELMTEKEVGFGHSGAIDVARCMHMLAGEAQYRLCDSSVSWV